MSIIQCKVCKSSQYGHEDVKLCFKCVLKDWRYDPENKNYINQKTGEIKI